MTFKHDVVYLLLLCALIFNRITWWVFKLRVRARYDSPSIIRTGRTPEQRVTLARRRVISESRAVIIPERGATGRTSTHRPPPSSSGERESADFVLDGDKRLANIATHGHGRSLAAAVPIGAVVVTAGGGGSAWAGVGGGSGAFRPTATATTHDREGFGRPGRDIELVVEGGRATSIDSSAPETKAWGSRQRCASPPADARPVRSPSTPTSHLLLRWKRQTRVEASVSRSGMMLPLVTQRDDLTRSFVRSPFVFSLIVVFAPQRKVKRSRGTIVPTSYVSTHFQNRNFHSVLILRVGF